MVGQFSIHQGPENEICETKRFHKRNQIALGFSRDGFHWHRPDRRPFIGARSDDAEAWDWGNIQSVGGGILLVGDALRIYYSGRSLWSGFWDGSGGTGVATLRRDGFASLEAGPDGGRGGRLEAPFGGLRAPSFQHLARCAPAHAPGVCLFPGLAPSPAETHRKQP